MEPPEDLGAAPHEQNNQRRRGRVPVILGAVACLMALGGFALRTDSSVCMVFLAWPLSAVALGGSLVALRRGSGRAGLPRGWLVSAGILFGFVFIGLTFVNLRRLAGLRYAIISSVASGERLKAIACEMDNYLDVHGTYPATLDVLYQRRPEPSLFVAPDDPQASRFVAAGDHLAYSSYVYHPGRGPRRGYEDLLLVYERDYFSPTFMGRVLCPYRLVMFDDNHVTSLSEAEFDKALQKDAARRQQLGWLTTQSAPSE